MKDCKVTTKFHQSFRSKITSFQTITLTNERDKVAVSMDDAVVNTIVPESGFRTPAEIGDAKAPTGLLLTTTVPVQTLKEYKKIAPGPARVSQGTFSPVSKSR